MNLPQTSRLLHSRTGEGQTEACIQPLPDLDKPMTSVLNTSIPHYLSSALYPPPKFVTCSAALESRRHAPANAKDLLSPSTTWPWQTTT